MFKEFLWQAGVSDIPQCYTQDSDVEDVLELGNVREELEGKRTIFVNYSEVHVRDRGLWPFISTTIALIFMKY